MTEKSHALTLDEATTPAVDEPNSDVRSWQIEKIKRGLKAADEGRFASAEAVKRIIRKHIPNG